MCEQNNLTGLEIAVIGMSGRFPGAKNIDEFRDNLEKGIESISFFSDHELSEAGIDSQLVKNPNYVKSRGLLEDIKCFDASFFGYKPGEAEIMDPQIRIFHECVWEVLEDAGYDSSRYNGLIGIYAGATSNVYWQLLSFLSGKADNLGILGSTPFLNKDLLPMELSYKLHLMGPAVSIQTACSTSLAAIHIACQAILNGECDMALAGGVTISLPRENGYIYQEGMIMSRDGHCRVFDAKANGTVSGEGTGVVALKRLEEAINDGDNILSVIKASAINNDGVRKVGFTAPSIKGQAEVIRTAHQMSEVEPESIGYIEAHGTGTELGDPVEMKALIQAFNTKKRNFCAIGSVKSNIGHLDSAAGVAGFIKTVLILMNKMIPPSLHFESHNPRIDFQNSPFYVNTRLREWKPGKYPRRAGVSSFGIGGTNAHVILEEAPEITRDDGAFSSRKYKLILLSAKTGSAMEKVTTNLAGYLAKHPDVNLADMAYTLQVGRREFKRRRMLVSSTVNEALPILSPPGSEALHTLSVEEDNPPVVFMFPGQGTQYVNMGLELYKTEAVFRGEMDRCFEILEPIMGYDLKEILYPGVICRGGSPYPPQDCVGAPGQGDHRGSPLQSDRINQTEITQPVIFVFEYALAKLLMRWGIEPYAMIGHSIGEYVAACLAGVFSLEDALALVALRGKLMQEMPGGAMLSVALSEKQLKPLLNKELALAAVNAPSLCTVSGSFEAIDALEKQLEEKGYKNRRLHTSHAFHSPLMDPILDRFREKVRKISFNKPEIPYISNVTGKWIAVEEAADPEHWARHLRRTVKFSDGVNELLKKENSLFFEVGPGCVLSTLVNQHAGRNLTPTVVNTVPSPQENVPDMYFLLSKIGRLWLSGVSIDWAAFYSDEKRNRISLPTYPFEAQHYWIEGDPSRMGIRQSAWLSLPGNKNDIADWFYIPSWKRTGAPIVNNHHVNTDSCWLVFIDECGLGSRVVNRLQPGNQNVIIVRAGQEFSKIGSLEYTVNPRDSRSYRTLFNDLLENNKAPDKILHIWGVTRDEPKIVGIQEVDNAQYSGFYSLLYLTQALANQGWIEPLHIGVVTNNMHEVNGENVSPWKATVLGAVNVIPKEFPNIHCISIDTIIPQPGDWQDSPLVEQLLAEMTGESSETMIAYRGIHRWIRVFEPIHPDIPVSGTSRLRPEGVYLITGGLGGIGFSLAQYLARTQRARLILTGRSEFPGRDLWDYWLEGHDEDDPTSRKIREIREMEKLGAEIMVIRADVANQQEMATALRQSQERFGRINGVIHSAGVSDGAMIQRRTQAITESVLAPKVKGTLILNHLLKDVELDFFILCSSLSSILYPFGQAAYCAANAFLDAFATELYYGRNRFVVSINWDGWKEVGMAVPAAKQLQGEINISPDADDGMSIPEGLKVFTRILAGNHPQVAVSMLDLESRIEQWRKMNFFKQVQDSGRNKKEGSSLYPRPHLTNPYTAPANPLEEITAGIWQNYLGIEQVGIHDNFFDLGATSMDMMNVNAKLKEALKREIPLVKLFIYPSIHSLTQYLIKEEKGKNMNNETKNRKNEINKGKRSLQNRFSLRRAI